MEQNHLVKNAVTLVKKSEKHTEGKAGLCLKWITSNRYNYRK